MLDVKRGIHTTLPVRVIDKLCAYGATKVGKKHKGLNLAIENLVHMAEAREIRVNIVTEVVLTQDVKSVASG